VIKGRVSAYREAIVPLQIHGLQGQELAIEAAVDTGFNGFLTLPPNVITTLSLPFRRNARVILGDGQSVMFDVHEAVVVWGGRLRRIPVDVADTNPLLGMSLLYGHELSVQVVEGGDVLIKELPPIPLTPA
jgi:clan AA aspartic protease